MRIFLWICVLLVGSLGCSDNTVYSHTHAINDPWTYEDGLSYSFDIKDVDRQYRMVLAVEHSADFDYQNIYVKTKTSFPDQSIKEGLVSLNIGNPKGGWNGDCSGDVCTADIVLQPRIKFPLAGTYTIEIEQSSRDKQLSGIKGMTLKINTLENE